MKIALIELEKLYARGNEERFAGNYNEAVKHYRKASKNGHAEATFTLAVFYLWGIVFRRDVKMAEDYFDCALAQGSLTAIKTLELKDEILSPLFRCTVKFAKKKNSHRWPSLIFDYKDHFQLRVPAFECLEVDSPTTWFAGLDKAHDVLGGILISVAFLNGLDICLDQEYGFGKLKEIVDYSENDPHYGEALYQYGLCYMDGTGVEKSISTAIDLFKEAAQLKHLSSVQLLCDYYKSLEPTIGNQSDANKWVEEYREIERYWKQQDVE